MGRVCWECLMFGAGVALIIGAVWLNLQTTGRWYG